MTQLEEQIKTVLVEESGFDEERRREGKINAILRQHIASCSLDPNVPYILSIRKDYYPCVYRHNDLESAIKDLVYELCRVSHWDLTDEEWYFYLAPITIGISWENIKPPEEE